MTAVATNRDRLRSIRERTHSAREARQRARTTLEAAQAAGDTEAAAIASLALDHAGIEVETSERLESMVLSTMAGVSNGHGLGGDSFLDDPGTVATLEQLAFSSQPIGNMALGLWQDAETFASSLNPRPRAQVSDDQPGLEGMRKQYGPIVRQVYRPLTLLDLIPSGTMGEARSCTSSKPATSTLAWVKLPRVRSSRKVRLASLRPRHRHARSRRGSSNVAKF